MKEHFAQALLMKVMNWTNEEDSHYRQYFLTMSRYKYDDYKQYFIGMKFIENFALWLNQFETNEDRKVALNFIKDKLIYISQKEMTHLVASAYPDIIERMLVGKIAKEIKVPEYKIKFIKGSIEFKKIKRQSLFLGLSDGARTEIFRRSNSSELSHEQIYLSYELSESRAKKMKEELEKDIKLITKNNYTKSDLMFKTIFLLDDFSASGTSYINYDKEEGKFKGKISSLYNDLKKGTLANIVDLKNTTIYLILYLCTDQAYDNINKLKDKLWDKTFPKLTVLPIYRLKKDIKLIPSRDNEIINICNDDKYYDKDVLEDEHTKKGGDDVKLGFGKCSLPIVLDHNTPNNSISILWAYDNAFFKGLFPRIPRHKVI